MQAGVIGICWWLCKRCELTMVVTTVSSSVETPPYVARSLLDLLWLTIGWPLTRRTANLSSVTSVGTLTSAWLDLSKGQVVDNRSSQRNDRLSYFLLTTSTDLILVCDHKNVDFKSLVSLDVVRSSLSHVTRRIPIIGCRQMTSF